MSPHRERPGWRRLADVEIPPGTITAVLLSLWWKQRTTAKAIDALPAAELGQLLGKRWREGTEREEQLLELQASVERMTRWLVRLTIALGVIGVGSIAATLWAALG
jgi:hypothetical protein